LSRNNKLKKWRDVAIRKNVIPVNRSPEQSEGVWNLKVPNLLKPGFLASLRNDTKMNCDCDQYLIDMQDRNSYSSTMNKQCYIKNIHKEMP
jgi:hypothetical protein